MMYAWDDWEYAYARGTIVFECQFGQRRSLQKDDTKCVV